MGFMSIGHWLVLLLVIVLLFGGRKIPSLMGDFAKGIKDFKKNLAEDDETSGEHAKKITIEEGEAVAGSVKERSAVS